MNEERRVEISVPEGAKKVDIFMLSYRQVPFDSLSAIEAMHQYSRLKGVDARLWKYGHALIHSARNNVFSHIRPDADFALFVDDDMIPHPDHLLKLMALDRPVALPLFTTRSEPVRFTLRLWDKKTETFLALEDIPRSEWGKGITDYFGFGMAFVLLRRDAIDAVLEMHLKGLDWLAEHKPLFDRMNIRASVREDERKRIEAIRRKKREKNRETLLFNEWRLDAEEERLGEDLSFCRRLILAGLITAVDTRPEMWVGHQGNYVYGPWDMFTPNNRELMENQNVQVVSQGMPEVDFTKILPTRERDQIDLRRFLV
jgi:Arc/MetJ-type ribon-helix-helix transcriptional regulator